MVSRRKRARSGFKHVSRRVPDDIQYRVSNSLLILVLGLMFIGYGAAKFEEQGTTALVISPPGEFAEWSFYMHGEDRTAQANEAGPLTNSSRYVYDTGAGTRITDPVIGGGRVYVGLPDGTVRAVGVRTGSMLWSNSAGASAIKHLAYSMTGLFASDSVGYLYLLDLSTGTQTWSYGVGSETFEPVVVGSAVYFGAKDGYFYKVASNGTKIFSVTPQINPPFETTSCNVTTSPAYYQGSFYLGTEKCGLVKYDPDGNLQGKYVIANPIVTLPSANSGNIYFFSTAYKVFAVNTNLQLQNSFNLPMLTTGVTPAAITTNGMHLAFMMSGDNKLWVIGTGVGSVFGAPLFVPKSNLPSSPASVDTAYIYYGGKSGDFNSVKLADGSAKWTYKTGATWISAPAIVDGTVFFTADNGKLYAIGPDKTPPTYSNLQQDSATPFQNENVTVSAAWSDNKGMASATLEIQAGANPAGNVSTAALSGTTAVSAFKILASQNVGTVVTWRIYGTDSDGNSVATAQTSFTIQANQPPTITSYVQDADRIGYNGTLTITVSATHGRALKEAILATDETGAWKNWTDAYGSKANLTGTSATATFRWQNAAYDVGTKISWKVYVRDSMGGEAVTGVRNFSIVSDPQNPVAVLVGQARSQIDVDESNQLYAQWTDNMALARAELWITESNLTNKNVDEALMSGKSAWSNFTYKPLGGDGTVVTWTIKGYDLTGNMAETPLQSFVVSKDKNPPDITGLAQSESNIEIGEFITLNAQVSDDLALKTAKLKIDGEEVDTRDLTGETTANLEFEYAPETIGSIRWSILAEDIAGNVRESDAKTFTVTGQLIECQPPAPTPSQYGACAEGYKSRVVYNCDRSAGVWKGQVENVVCETTSDLNELPIAYMLVGTVLIALSISSLIVYKKEYYKRFFKKKGEGAPEKKAEKPAAKAESQPTKSA